MGITHVSCNPGYRLESIGGNERTMMRCFLCVNRAGDSGGVSHDVVACEINFCLDGMV